LTDNIFHSLSFPLIHFHSPGFSRLEIDPFPFCAKLFWDGSGKDLGEIPSWNEHSPRLLELLQMQKRPDVMRMRDIREALRGCAHSNQTFFLWIERDEPRTREVDDGTDANGNRKTRTEHYVVHWEYMNGTIQIRGDYGTSAWEQGFNLTMSYADGEGIEVGGSQQGTRHHHGTHVFNGKKG
jgi:hypothetical protein